MSHSRSNVIIERIVFWFFAKIFHLLCQFCLRNPKMIRDNQYLVFGKGREAIDHLKHSGPWRFWGICSLIKDLEFRLSCSWDVVAYMLYILGWNQGEDPLSPAVTIKYSNLVISLSLDVRDSGLLIPLTDESWILVELLCISKYQKAASTETGNI